MLKVSEIFRSIQGEGRLTGVPMTFIRLFGCSQDPRCWFCDTPQEDYQELSIEGIVANVQDRWACITGGEPTIHEELPALTKALYERGIKVALETNGTNPLPGMCHWVCVSPKDVWPCTDVLVRAHDIKLLVGSGMYDAEEAIERCKGTWVVEGPYRVEPSCILLQPVWDGNYEANLQRAIGLCQKHQVRLSVQVHKYIEVR